MIRSTFKGKRIAITAITLMLLSSLFMVGASADYYLIDTETKRQFVSRTYENVDTIFQFGDVGELSAPTDLFIDSKDTLYVVDSGKSRIVIRDVNGNVRTISGAFGPDNVALSKPEGIYVDDTGSMFIADTDNGRILHLDANGVFVEQFVEPDEETYSTEMPFKPSKVYVDNMGRLYCTNSSDYHGIIVIDGNNDFSGYIGATKVETTISERVKRFFATKDQLEQYNRQVPAYVSNFLIKDNFIYATSYWGTSNQLKIYTPSGENIYKEKFYGQNNSQAIWNYNPAFVDITVDSQGIIYAADFVTSRIYVYDQEGNNLAVFGSFGKRKYCFDSISSLAMDSQDRLYVLDRTLNTIQVFSPTDRMKNVLKATTLFNEGKYEDASIPWKNVLAYDSADYMANVGLAKNAYREGDYPTALNLYKTSFDKAGYSQVFTYYRISILRDYFVVIFFGVLLLIIALVLGVARLKRYADKISSEVLTEGPRLGVRGFGRLSLLMIFHPIDGFYALKVNRKKLTYLPAVVMLFLLTTVHILYLYSVHFPLASLTMGNLDMVKQVAVILLPVILWIIIGFSLTSIMDGKQTFKEAATATAFSFVPYIVFLLPLALFSHALGRNEAGLYNFLFDLVLIWSLAMVLLSTKIMNQYSFGKLVGMVLLIVFAIVCFIMIGSLFYIVVQKAFSFFKQVYEEIVIIMNS